MSEEMPETAESRLLAAIEKYWGYDSFRSFQRDSMLAVMESRDSLTVLPTGGGKSLCYQAPAVCRDGMAVVVSPLIALMKDQVDALVECGVPAAFINSSLTTQERLNVAGRIRAGELKLLFVAPERLVQERTLQFLEETRISFIAIDEAHCISNWGHDFRPEYRQLNRLRDAFPDVSIHAYTATATERVRRDIADQLHLRDAEILVGNFDRPNLLYRVERRRDQMDQIRTVIDRHPHESGIVYCISRANVESTAAALSALGHKALPYHAGLSPEKRRDNQSAFIDEKADIIVATVAFGMGIDKSNVRYVVHAEMPSSMEAYQQESGRAGRDGLEAECCLIYSGRDTNTWEFLISQSENEENRQASLTALKKMEAFCASAVCRHQQLVRHFGQKLDSENCGSCDVCLDEVEVIPDALVVGQKIISSVYRQEQRFGAEYTGLVLRGSRSKKVLNNRHDKLSTYGLLREEPDQVVRGWIDQLIAQGFLARSGEHSVIVITEEGTKVLRGETTPLLTRAKQQRTAVVREDRWEGVDRGLFEDLRQLRMDIADQRGVPPYVIFGDMTLRELSRYRPTKIDQLLQIHGIGQQKLDEFGAAFASRVSEYCAEHQLKADLPVPAKKRTVKPVADEAGGSPKMSVASGAYFELFDQGLSRDEVALQLDRAQSTVSQHLVTYIQARNIPSAEPWVGRGTIEQIENAVHRVGTERLKPVFDTLRQEVSYDDIRIVLACLRVREQNKEASE